MRRAYWKVLKEKYKGESETFLIKADMQRSNRQKTEGAKNWTEPSFTMGCIDIRR